MNQNQEMMTRLASSLKDRALYLAFLYRAFAKALPREEVEKLARQAIFEYGQFKGRQDGGRLSPQEWVSRTPQGDKSVFGTRVEKSAGEAKEIMVKCPLVEAWQEMGLAQDEISLLCDIAMEVDRGRAAFHGLKADLPERIGQGDEACLLIIRPDQAQG